ncbi:MAG: hypothetical protein IJR16_10350, partial [Spirochaetales bacterium]|nr:hypothetical protein [Spirochaetales bacterium]
FFSQKGTHNYWDIPSEELFSDKEIWLVFGRESRGLDEDLLLRHRERCVRIPMLEGKRSLNLSNAVAVAVYEVLRRSGFDGLKAQGSLGKGGADV